MSDSSIAVAPGKGPPRPGFMQAVLLGKLAIPGAARILTWDACRRIYSRESQQLVELGQLLTPVELARCVKVRRMLGVRSFTRGWSINLIAQHLMLLEVQFARILLDLSYNRIPEVRLALDTPLLDDGYPGDVFDDLKAAIEDFTVRLENEIGDTDSTRRFAHPTFGLLTCRQWQVVAVATQWVRRRHATEIARRLRAERARDVTARRATGGGPKPGERGGSIRERQDP